MFSSIHQHCTPTNVLLTLALVFAMTGGAYAAKKSRRVVSGSLPVAVFLVMLALTAPLAQARITHNYESVITEVPEKGPGGESVPAPGGLQEVNSMRVFSGDLYVAEHLQGEGVAGELARADQWRPSLSKPGEYEFVAQLPPQPELGGGPSGVAFGSGGPEAQMYLGQSSFDGTTGVNVFAAGSCGSLECATFQKFWTGAEVPENGPFVGVEGVAVDHSTTAGDWASGDVFVTDFDHGVIDIFDPQPGGAEKYVQQVTGPGPGQNFVHEPGVGILAAVSGFNGDLVVGNGEAVYVLRPEEEAAEKKYGLVCQLVPPAGPVKASSVAVDDSTVGTFAGEIYIGTSQGVYEFGPECGFRGSIAGVPKEGTPGGVKGQTEEVPLIDSSSLAIDPVTHKVFIGSRGSVDVFGPDVVVPDVVTEAPSNLVLETDPQTGVVSWGISPTGNVNPLGEGEASCWFVWGLTELFGHEAPCSPPRVPEGGAPVSVNGSLTGLEPDTAYVYRLQAKNEHGTNQGEPSEDYRFRTPGPGLRSESVSGVSSSSATFEATVAPHDTPVTEPAGEHDLQAPAKSPASYFFQYSTQPTGVCFAEPPACTSVPSVPVSVGSGTEGVQVSQHVQGLAPNTTYHYRAVAMNEALPEAKPGVLVPFYGPDRTFTTQGAGGPVVLPDGRAWELVSPADKHGALIEPSGQAAAGGSEFTFRTDIPTEPVPPGSPFRGVQVLSSRSVPGEWASVDIPLARSGPEGAIVVEKHEYRLFSEDFGLAVAESEGPFSIPQGSHQNGLGEWELVVEASPIPRERTPYLRHNTTCASMPSSCYEPLLDGEDVTSGLKYEGTEETKGAANFVAGTPDGNHLFILSSVRLTSTPAPNGGLYEWAASRPPAERLSLVSVAPDGTALPAGVRAVAPDGSRIVLGPCGAIDGTCGDLYVRDLVSGEAARLNVNEAGSPVSGQSGWVGAGADASKTFFTFNGPLTTDSESSGGLYVCELASAPLRCALTDLTPQPVPGQPGFGEHITPSTALGVSGDGSRAYFMANGVLADGAKPGAPNLYVAHEQEGKWTTSFIASPADVEPEHRVSTDGRWLAFSTKTSLTGYDNRDAKTGQPDSEVYLYDAETAKLVCASCDSTGARPTGSSEVPPPLFEVGRPGAEESPNLPHEADSRSLFDTGRMFFDSADALVPQDKNGNTDVYEFEPASVGDCTSASATFNAATGGCVGLISSGVASGESVFLDASTTGSDAFFNTTERLVAQDRDTALDVYDAHECTASSPCAPQSEPSPEDCQSAEACRSVPEPQPSIFGAPSSATFFGPGNLTPGPPAKPRSAAQIRAEKLSIALESCRHRYKGQRKRRVACEKRAHVRYGPPKARKRSMKPKPAPTHNRRSGR